MLGQIGFDGHLADPANARDQCSSAVTALLDRMERQGLIERRHDPGDRRRVIVVSAGKREQEVARAFQPLRLATQQVLERYSSAELELITGFMQQLDTAMERLARSLSTRAP